MSELLEVLSDLFTKLDALKIPYLIGGSFASSSWGVPRQTHDLDLSIRLTVDQVANLVEALESDYLVQQAEIEESLASKETYRSFQLLHIEKVFKVDVFVPLIDEYSESEFSRRRKIEVISGVVAYCATAENIVLQKLRWYELGSRVSDRQWNDIVQVLEVQMGNLDLEYLTKWSKHFGVYELLREAFDQAFA